MLGIRRNSAVPDGTDQRSTRVPTNELVGNFRVVRAGLKDYGIVGGGLNRVRCARRFIDFASVILNLSCERRRT